MSIIVNLYYTGQNGSARKFVEEMTARGIVDEVWYGLLKADREIK